MSTFIKIPGVNPPMSRPRVDLPDSVMPENSGTLVLFDASHSLGAWPSGVAAGMALPNLASAQATALTGKALSGVMEIGGTVGDFTLTRTAKKGLHVSPRTGSLTDSYCRFAVPGLAEYVFKNPDHSYYLSQWTKATRNGESSSFTGTISTAYNSYLASLYRREAGLLGAYPAQFTDASNLLGSRVGTQAIGQAALSNVATSGWVGTKQATAAAINAYPFMLGRTGPAQSTVGHPALVIYRCYIEDLTASKRTYAEADAADAAAFTRECMTPGGRYYGDDL